MAGKRVRHRFPSEREVDSGESAASAGFLPGKNDAVNNGDGGNYGDDPEHRTHAIEEASNDQQHQALGPFHEADLTQGNEGLGAGARITDHDGAGGGDSGEHDVRSTA